MGRKTIGIPRALFFYYLFPLWQSFFKELGFKVISSPITDKRIVDLGVKKAVDEVCYPVKIYYGHLASLSEQVDYLFVPRLVSIEKRSYICPKFMGLPDMIRASFPRLPAIVEQTFDASRNSQGVHHAFAQLGNKLGFDQKQVRQAVDVAFTTFFEYEKKLVQGFSPIELLEDNDLTCIENKNALRIGLLGHGYNIYDTYASMDIITKLRNLGADVITVEMINSTLIDNAAKSLPKRMFWTLGRKVLGSTLYLKNEASIAGIIHVASFGCGPDSMVAELVERSIRRQKAKPFLSLTIDEHTGEAGLNTRLEAFMDMVARRNIS